MEPTTIALIFLLLFGGVEHIQKKEAQKEVAALEIKLEETNQALNIVKEVNDSNASTINDLKNSVNECGQRYAAAVDKVNQFKEVKSVQDAAIQNLQNSLTDSDFAQCRVPDGVSLEGIEAAKD